MQLLEKHFGDEMKIAYAYLDKALNWTAIKTDDGKALQAYSLYLRKCHNAMQDLEYMDDLDVTSTLKLIVSKLPYKLRERWRSRAYEEFHKRNIRAKFRHIVEFLENQSNILLHPAFGDIKDPTPVQRISPKNRSTEIRTLKSRSTFVTAVAAPGEQDTKHYTFKGQQHTNLNAATSAVCCFCKGKHALLDCFKFKS